MAHLYCNGGNRFNFVSIRNYTQNNFGGGYSYGCSMPSFGGIFSNWGTGIYTGCACNGGWSWSAFAGNTFGSLVGNVLGMLWGGNNGLYSGIGYTSGSTQGQKTTGNNGNDTDYKKINDLADNMKKNETLISAKTNCTLNNCNKKILQVVLHNYRERIKDLRENLDNNMDDQNKRQLNNLEAQINELDEKFGIDSTKSPVLELTNNSEEVEEKGTEEHTTPVTAEAPQKKNTDPIAPNDTDNTYNESMIPSGWVLPDGYTQPEAKDISDDSIIQVEDTSKRTKVIPVTACNVSPAGKNTNNFPATLKITDSDGKTRFYHYVDLKGDCPVYITPNTDKNHNVYVLCKQGNEYKLMQFKDFNGYGKGDHQVK
ncbi:MAG: hypothetical protein Q4E83_06180 [bacterium]|nr:hypothetical protein [bacterium]